MSLVLVGGFFTTEPPEKSEVPNSDMKYVSGDFRREVWARRVIIMVMHGVFVSPSKFIC